MSYPKQLLKLRPIGGLAKDVPPWEVGPNNYTIAENVTCRLGFPARRDGERLAYDPPSVPPLELLNYIKDFQIMWVYVGESSQWVVIGSTHTDITVPGPVLAALLPQMHSLFAFNGTVIHNSSSEIPAYWAGNPAIPFAPLPGWPAATRASRMVPHKYHIFALAIDEAGITRPNKVMWSDAAEPGTVPSTWTPGPDNEAGDTELADSGGFIMTAATLRDSLLIYKRNAVYQANYVGGNQVYEFRPLFRNVGSLCPRGVVETNNGHYFIADNDVLFTDGISLRSIAHGRIRSAIFSALDFTVFERAFVTYNRSKNEVMICVPEIGQQYATRGFIYSIDSDAWSERDLPLVSAGSSGLVNDGAIPEDWDSDPQAWDLDGTLWSSSPYTITEKIMFASPGPPGKFTLTDAQVSEVINAKVAKHDLTFDNPERIKFLRRLHVRRETSTACTFLVRVGARMNPEDPITWQPEVAMTGDQVVNVAALGRYISFEIRTADNAVWRLSGVDLEAELRGYH